MEFRVATLNDLDLLTTSRIEVLRAANKLDTSTDMANVEKELKKNPITITKKHWRIVRILHFS